MPTAATQCPSADVIRRHVDAWLLERQEVISLFNALQNKLHDDTISHDEFPLLQEFCQVLMDYISAGYFEIYRELLQAASAARPFAADTLASMLAPVHSSTDLALNFNDQFSDARTWHDHHAILLTELTRLMLALEERFNSEDALIRQATL